MNLLYENYHNLVIYSKKVTKFCIKIISFIIFIKWKQFVDSWQKYYPKYKYCICGTFLGKMQLFYWIRRRAFEITATSLPRRVTSHQSYNHHCYLFDPLLVTSLHKEKMVGKKKENFGKFKFFCNFFFKFSFIFCHFALNQAK